MPRKKRGRLRSITFDGCIGSRVLLPPPWDKHGDVLMTPRSKPIDADLDAPTREAFLVAVTVEGNDKRLFTRLTTRSHIEYWQKKLYIEYWQILTVF